LITDARAVQRCICMNLVSQDRSFQKENAAADEGCRAFFTDE
jgi:hypothetical protein